MDGERWNRVQALFHESAALPKTDRARFLEAACGGDAGLAAEVMAMLDDDADGSSLLDGGLPRAIEHFTVADMGAEAAREFGPYRLERLLGEGGMGVVWLARRKDAGNLVAVKFLPHAALSPARRERFASEIRTLARLKHPYIARLYDAGSLPDGTPWFVMEYVEGQSLSDYLAARNPPIPERIALFRAICEAVQYAHGQEVIHRDLKPSNIMVEKDGTPRLVDFGVAKQLHGLDMQGQETRPGLRFVSPDYAAPEWIGDGIVGFSTDVYSLGVILFEMLAGRLPFDAAKTAAGRPSELSPLTASKADWSDLDTLCLAAIHADPKQRYGSVEALIRDIDRYMKKEPLEARPDRFSYRAGKFIRRNRRAVLAAAAAFVLLAGQLTYFTVRLARARDTAVAEAARTRRIQSFMLNLIGAGDQNAGPSSELRVASLLDRGARQADMLKTDPETQAELYKTIGTMYQLLGKYPEADKMLEAAVGRMKTAAGPGDPRFADAVVQLGLLRGDEARFKEAEQLARQGVAIVDRRLPPNDPAVINAHWALGQVLDQSGAYEKALGVLNPLVSVKASGQASSITLADTYTGIGYADNSLGRYDEGASYFGRALALDQRLFGRAHPRVATDLSNMGTDAIMRGRNQDAEADYRRALAIMQTWYGPDHPDTAEIQGFLALTFTREGKLAEAEPLLVKVLPIEERVKGANHPYLAVILDALGKVATKRGDLPAAEADLTRALSINRATYGEKRYQTAVSMANLADVMNKEGRYAEAAALLFPAERVLASLPASNNDSLPLAQVSLGRALIRQKRYREAEPFLIAGHDFFSLQPARSPERLRESREDLEEIYTVLREPEKAARYRAELEGPASGNRNR